MYQRALQGFEKVWGPDHTSTLDTVHNLGNLYVGQGKLAEAEQMYQRALQGYEKAFGLYSISTYVLVLNIIFNLGLLFEHRANLAKAKTIFSEALRGYKQVFGPHYAKSEKVQNKLYALDAVLESKALVNIKGHEDKVVTGTSHLSPNTTPSPSKRHKLFRKLGIR
jgi:tetratricopeptide (TPR) repeat protein